MVNVTPTVPVVNAVKMHAEFQFVMCFFSAPFYITQFLTVRHSDISVTGDVYRLSFCFPI